MKQILKESQLRDIVREALNELDWRTYANAAKKRDAQIQQVGRDATDKGGNRLTHLRNNLDYAASDALTSKYAQKYNNGYPTNNADVYTKNGYQTVTTNNFDGKGRQSRGEFNYDNKGGVDKQGNVIDSPMDDEVENYMNGNSTYVNGKGWQNNESKLHNIVKESIRKYVNEGHMGYDHIQEDSAITLRKLINPNYHALKDVWKNMEDLADSSFVESDPELKSDFEKCKSNIFGALFMLGFINRKLNGFSTYTDAD